MGCIVWLTEQALLGRPGQDFWWVAPTYGVAKIAWRRMKRALPDHLFTSTSSPPSITIGGRIITFKGADNPDNLYGEDVFAAVIDEATRCKEEAWIALRSTLTATRGPVRIIGNVKGKKNWAYQLARRAEGGAKGMSYAKLTAWDAVEGGVLEREEIEDAKAQLPEHVFQELYLAEPGDDGTNPFGLEAIEACVQDGLSDEEPVCWGWDLAKKQDWTVGVGLDRNRRVCRFLRFQKPWGETEATILPTVAVPGRVDSTGVGDPIAEKLERHPGSNCRGFLFTARSKQQLMEGLAYSIQTNLVGVLEGIMRSELEQFEYAYTRTGVRYEAPAGMHDDTVMALALALVAYKEWEGAGNTPGFWFPSLED